MQSDSNSVAVVTGTSRGLGLEIARALLDGRWRVHGVARGAAPAALAEHPAYSHARLDLGALDAVVRYFEEEWRATIEPAPARFLLVNNAGILGGVRSVASSRPADLDAALRVNATTPIWLMGFALRIGARATTIVNVSSGAATSPYPGWVAYCSSKAALEMAGRVLAEEEREVPALAGRDLRVLSYAPHVVATEMQAELRAADAAEFPRKARFEALFTDGQLVPAEDPARDLVRLIEDPATPPYLATRYTPPK